MTFDPTMPVEFVFLVTMHSVSHPNLSPQLQKKNYQTKWMNLIYLAKYEYELLEEIEPLKVY